MKEIDFRSRREDSINDKDRRCRLRSGFDEVRQDTYEGLTPKRRGSDQSTRVVGSSVDKSVEY